MLTPNYNPHGSRGSKERTDHDGVWGTVSIINQQCAAKQLAELSIDNSKAITPELLKATSGELWLKDAPSLRRKGESKWKVIGNMSMKGEGEGQRRQSEVSEGRLAHNMSEVRNTTTRLIALAS